MKINEVRHLITYDCNLRCLHCYMSAGEHRGVGKEFTQEESDRFYGFFRPDVVSATGGEPLLKKDLVRIIARSTAKYGGAMELVTNGMFLTEELVNELNALNPRTFYQISLDGTQDYHNHIRQNPQAYEKALGAIDMASASGAKTKVRLTATEGNWEQIPEIIKVLDSYGRTNIKLVIRPILSAGRAVQNNLKARTDFSDLNKLAGLAKVIQVETTDNQGKCGCGVDTVAVSPNGDIFPCTYFVFDEKYRMGNINDNLENLAEVEEFKRFGGACYARRSKSP